MMTNRDKLASPDALDAPPSFLEKPDRPPSEPAPLERSNLQLYLQEIARRRS